MRTNKTDRIGRGVRFAAFASLMIVLFVPMVHAQAIIDTVKIGNSSSHPILLRTSGVAAPRNIFIQDPGAAANVILSTRSGTSQTITGPLQLSGTPSITASTGTPSTYLAVNSSHQVITGSGITGLTGNGTTNAIPVWTSSTILGNSLLTDNGTLLNYNSGMFTDTASDGGLFVAGTLGVTSTATLSSISAGIPYNGFLALNGTNQVVAAGPSTNPIGSGTANTIALWVAPGKVLQNSLLTDNATLLKYNSNKMVDTASDGGIFFGGNFHTGGAIQVQSVSGGTGTYSATYNDFEISGGSNGHALTITPYDNAAGRVYLINALGNKTVSIGTVSLTAPTTALVISDGTNWHQITQ